MNIAAAQRDGTKILQQADIAEFRREASSLLAFVLQKDAAFLIAHPEFELTAAQASAFETAIKRRTAHEPFQYITGKQEFWGLEFEVTPAVLIPRPETEILVDAAIGILSQIESPHFCEVGVGSGCIAVSIAHSVPAVTAVATDISPAALSVATRNAKRHNVDTRIEFRTGDVFAGVTGSFDMIVSNPPYVPDEEIEALQAEVRDFEPRAWPAAVTALTYSGDRRRSHTSNPAARCRSRSDSIRRVFEKGLMASLNPTFRAFHRLPDIVGAAREP